MYLPPPLSSATFTVTLQTCKPSSSLYLAHSLALINHPHPLYSLLFWMQPLCLSLSLSLFLPHVNSHFSNMYTIPLSLSHVLAFLSLQPCSPPLFPLSLSFFLYLSPIISHHLSLSHHLPSSLSLPSSPIISLSPIISHHLSLSHHLPSSLSLPSSPIISLSLPSSPIISLSLPSSLSLSLSLSLQPCSPILLSSVVDATSLAFSHSPFLSLPLSLTPPFSHSPFLSLPLSSATHTFYSLLLQIRPLSVYLQLR